MSAAALNGTITLFFPTVNQAAPDKAFIQHNVDNGRTVCVCVCIRLRSFHYKKNACYLILLGSKT